MTTTFRPFLFAAGAVVATGLSAAPGASQAAPFVSASGEMIATDAEGVVRSVPFGFSQQQPFTRIDKSVFRESILSDGTSGSDLTGLATLSASYDTLRTETGAHIIRLGNNVEQGTATVTGSANTSLHDIVRVTGTATTPGQVILHRTLHVTGDASAGEFLETREDHIEASATMSLFSNGMVGLLSNPLIAFNFESIKDRVIRTGNDSFDQTFDFSIALDLNSQTDIDVELLNQFAFSLTDIDGDGPGNEGNLQGGVFLRGAASFVGAALVTDAAGNTLCGLTISADSGADWGSIAACPTDPGGGTGGGGTGGGGTGGGAGGVPEPATWALMIGGFGGVGSMLRRRRSATAPG